MRHYEHARDTTIPSVSIEELQHYENLREEYNTGA
jgi:hypothetical protein